MRRVWPGARVSVVRLSALAALALAAVAVLVVHVADSSSGGVRAAPEGGSPACLRVAGGYPDGVAGLDRAGARASGAAVWGGGEVTARCGVRPPAPTTDACVTVDGVDWVWRPSSPNGRRVLVTYGRDPAVEITISGRVTAVDDVLVRLSGAVKPIGQRARCVGDADVGSLAPAAKR